MTKEQQSIFNLNYFKCIAENMFENGLLSDNEYQKLLLKLPNIF